MRTLLLLVLAVGLSVLGTAPAAEKDKKKSDADKMQGTWQPTKIEISGIALPDEIVNNLKYEITGNKIVTVGVPEVIKEYGEGSFKLDGSTTPKCMDFTVTAGAKKGDEIEGIYSLTDDELKICVKMVGKERPNEFVTKEGDNRGLLIMKRVKK